MRGTQYDEEAVAREAEPSPHFGGRAQPGDVIGLETGGEQTHVGETTEDENKRRRDAEDEAATRRNRQEARRTTPSGLDATVGRTAVADLADSRARAPAPRAPDSEPIKADPETIGVSLPRPSPIESFQIPSGRKRLPSGCTHTRRVHPSSASLDQQAKRRWREQAESADNDTSGFLVRSLAARNQACALLGAHRRQLPCADRASSRLAATASPLPVRVGVSLRALPRAAVG